MCTVSKDEAKMKLEDWTRALKTRSMKVSSMERACLQTGSVLYTTGWKHQTTW